MKYLARQNFIATVIWHKKHTRSNDAKFFSDNHDFIIVYAKDKNFFHLNLLPRTEGQNKGYKNPDNDPRGVWASQPIQVKTPSEAYIYEIKTPPRQLQQIVYELPHAPCARRDPPEKALALFIQHVFIILQQCLAETVNPPERGAQVVRNRIGKSFEFPVGGFELSRAFNNAPFELPIELLDFFLGSFAFGNIAGRGKDPDDFPRFVVVHCRIVQNRCNMAIAVKHIERVVLYRTFAEDPKFQAPASLNITY